jgi:3-hydroxybutyryl-CoA dehydrogenase/3-hydroxyacyl-CoA dehydrogenase
MTELRVGVIGAGVMGSGIAQTLAVAGYETVCCDSAPAALERAKSDVVSGRFGMEAAVSRGKLTSAAMSAALARLTWSDSLAMAAVADLIVECVPERIELKIRVFRELDRLAKPTAILASNTSGFSIAALAAATERPERVVGWHWASPPPVMRFAEIVAAEHTSQTTIETVVEVARACGKNPVVVKDNAMAWGFVANRVYFAMIREARAVVDDGVATREQVNQLMVDCFRWPIGPFAMVEGATRGWK